MAGNSPTSPEPIRVLHVVGAMDRAGTETMIMNLYRSFDRERYQFDFLVHEERACDYDGEIERLGGRLYRLPRFNGMNARSYQRAVRALLAEHSEWAIVHGHIGSSAALYLREARRLGRKTVAHSHAQHFPLSAGEVAFRVVSYPTRFIADEFLACSQTAGLDRFGKSVVTGSHFRVLKNGIAVERYACDETAHREAKHRLGLGAGPIIGHVGRLTEVKNHDFLLEVFGLLLQREPGARLVLVGRGEREDELRSLVAGRGLADAVVFYGVTDDVASVLKGLDGFVFPSHREGLPVALVEAQASGVPCLMSTGVSPEALISPSAVRLPLGEGAARWAETLCGLLAAGNRRGEGAVRVRETGFDIEESSRWLMGFYDDLLGRPAPHYSDASY